MFGLLSLAPLFMIYAPPHMKGIPLNFCFILNGDCPSSMYCLPPQIMIVTEVGILGENSISMIGFAECKKSKD